MKEALALTTTERGVQDRFARWVRDEERDVSSGAPITKRSAVDGIHHSELHESERS
jgi:hypothetical protein